MPPARLRHPTYCPKHTQVAAPAPPEPAEIASALTANLDDFTSAAQINDFLSRLLLLLAQDKISTRRAAVLAYITSQLLRTLPAIAKEENRDETTIIWDMPGPDHESPAPRRAADPTVTASTVEKVPA